MVQGIVFRLMFKCLILSDTLWRRNERVVKDCSGWTKNVGGRDIEIKYNYYTNDMITISANVDN